VRAGVHKTPCTLEIIVAEIRTVTRTPFRKNTAFKSWWKTSTGLLLAPASGEMTWRAWAIAVAVGFGVASWDIIFGDESYREVLPPPAEPTAPTL